MLAKVTLVTFLPVKRSLMGLETRRESIQISRLNDRQVSNWRTSRMVLGDGRCGTGQ